MTTASLLYRVGNALRAAGYTRASSHRDRTGFSLQSEGDAIQVRFYIGDGPNYGTLPQIHECLKTAGFDCSRRTGSVLVTGMASPAEVQP